MEPPPLENYFNKETFKQSLLKLLIKGANNPGSSGEGERAPEFDAEKTKELQSIMQIILEKMNAEEEVAELLNEVQKLINDSADVNSVWVDRDGERISMLMFFIDFGEGAMVEELIERGADAKATVDNVEGGVTVLERFVEQVWKQASYNELNTGIMEALINAGADVNYSDRVGTALHRIMPDLTGLDGLEGGGAEQLVKIVDILMMSGVDVNKEDGDGQKVTDLINKLPSPMKENFLEKINKQVTQNLEEARKTAEDDAAAREQAAAAELAKQNLEKAQKAADRAAEDSGVAAVELARIVRQFELFKDNYNKEILELQWGHPIIAYGSKKPKTYVEFWGEEGGNGWELTNKLQWIGYIDKTTKSGREYIVVKMRGEEVVTLSGELAEEGILRPHEFYIGAIVKAAQKPEGPLFTGLAQITNVRLGGGRGGVNYDLKWIGGPAANREGGMKNVSRGALEEHVEESLFKEYLPSRGKRAEVLVNINDELVPMEIVSLKKGQDDQQIYEVQGKDLEKMLLYADSVLPTTLNNLEDLERRVRVIQEKFDKVKKVTDETNKKLEEALKDSAALAPQRLPRGGGGNVTYRPKAIIH